MEEIREGNYGCLPSSVAHEAKLPSQRSRSAQPRAESAAISNDPGDAPSLKRVMRPIIASTDGVNMVVPSHSRPEIELVRRRDGRVGRGRASSHLDFS